MELNEFFTTVILTAAVFAALVTSIANIIISLMNNWRLKKIEKQKQKLEKDQKQFSNEVTRMMKYLQKTSNDAEKELYMD